MRMAKLLGNTSVRPSSCLVLEKLSEPPSLALLLPPHLLEPHGYCGVQGEDKVSPGKKGTENIPGRLLSIPQHPQFHVS